MDEQRIKTLQEKILANSATDAEKAELLSFLTDSIEQLTSQIDTLNKRLG